MVRDLKRLLIDRDEGISLDIAALELATIEFPRLDIPGFLEILDSHARELDSLLARTASGEEFIASANEYFFQNLGFHGNEEDYYDPRNSCLNEVLVNRIGIPITLSVVYMEIARRLNRPVAGIGMPGHFLVQYRGEDYSAFIDCFHGKVLSVEECREIALQSAKIDIFAIPSALAPSTKWQILVRMLNNLRNVYYRAQDFEKAIAVLDLLIEAIPSSAEEYKQRGVIQLHLKHPQPALQDLETYLKLAPQAQDREEIESHIENVRRLLQAMN